MHRWWASGTCAFHPGSCSQVIYAGGTTSSLDPQVIPVTATARTSAASHGNAPDRYFSTVADNGIAVRELVVALPPGFAYRGNDGGFRQVPAAGGALQITAPLTGVNQELRKLAVALWLIVLIGVALGRPPRAGCGADRAPPIGQPHRHHRGAGPDHRRLPAAGPGGPDELGRLRRAFNRLLVALDSSRESQRQLVLDASHELRTPLTSLRTNMEVARRMEELAPGEREVLIGDVLTQLDELTALVADLAELARGEQPTPTAGPVRFDSLVLSAIEAATTHGRSRSVTFEAIVTENWVSGNAPRIERAVDNLLDNALKWSPDGGVVEVSCANGILLVRDHGPGVAESDIDHIFDRFYRAPGARGRPGSGLGLAIVAQVARDEGGRVSAHQAPGGGALFQFALPPVPPPGPGAQVDGSD